MSVKNHSKTFKITNGSKDLKINVYHPHPSLAASPLTLRKGYTLLPPSITGFTVIIANLQKFPKASKHVKNRPKASRNIQKRPKA